MRTSVFFFAFALFVLVSAQTTERFAIDDFTVNQNQAVLFTLTSSITNTSAPQTQGNSFFKANCGQGLIGCGRNMRIEVLQGEAAREFTSQIFPSNTFPNITGEWDISNPKGGQSINYNTYDGSNTNYLQINDQGLGGVDFTEGGLSIGLRFALISDLASTFSIDIYDTNGVVCTGTAQFNVRPGQTYTESDITDDILYSSFRGNCAFTSVGAVEIQIPSGDAVDAIVYEIRGAGFPNPSASTTPSVSAAPSSAPSQSQTPVASPSQSAAASQSSSQTPAASISRTPAASPSSSPSPSSPPSQSRTPAPSQSNTPAPSQSQTPTPSTSKECSVVCNCPVFTCHLVYGFHHHQGKDLFYN